MTEFDVVIKDGTIFDGRRNPRWRADIAIKDGLIASIGHVSATGAARVIDASGLHVAPGFVDLHTHYDSQVFWDPYCSTSGWHGVTSVVIGNCGFGFAPVAPEARDRAMLAMSRNEAVPLVCMQQGMPWDWVTFPEFLDSLERTPKAVNVLTYVPLAPLMIWVMGLGRAKAGALPTPAEHAEMRRLLGEALDAGACGFSAQRLGHGSTQRDYDGTPMVTDVMHDETMLELGRLLADRNEGFIQYTYFESEGFATSVGRCRGHLEELAEVSGRPIIWNLVHPGHGMDETIAWLEGAHARGLTIYPQGATNLVSNVGLRFNIGDNHLDFSSAWTVATVGTLEEQIAKLSDPAVRERLKDPDELKKLAALGHMGDWVMHRAENPSLAAFQEMKLKDIASARGTDDLVDAFCDLAVEDRLASTFYVELPPPDFGALRRLVENPITLPGISDGGAHTKAISLGCYPTEYLIEYVRNRAWLTLEEAHWRLSAYPAHCAGFRDRGTLVEGAPADIVVYDYGRLRILPDEVARDYPGGEWRRVRKAEGYRYVFVNGEVTIEDDREVGSSPGRLLRHGMAEVA